MYINYVESHDLVRRSTLVGRTSLTSASQF
jgi:hypothetical protein